MTMNRDHKVRERAHEIWEKAGRPHGQSDAHWEQAEREIAQEHHAAPNSETGTASAAPAAKPRARRAASPKPAAAEPAPKKPRATTGAKKSPGT